MIQTWNSSFARQDLPGDGPVCALEAGVLAAFFSELAGRELHCLQTSCESLGAESNQFVLGAKARLLMAEVLVEQQVPHLEIMAKLSST